MFGGVIRLRVYDLDRNNEGKCEFEMKKLKRFFKKEEGATAIEYALIAALIAIVIVAAVTAVGIAVQIPFNTVAGAL